MILKSKICGVSDSKILDFIVNHKYPPQFIGFIVNYPKSKRYVELDKLKELINIDGIGETQVKSLEKFFQNKTNIKVVEKLSEILSVKDREVKSKGKLKNVSFMFTGKLQNISRAEAKSLIEENAGNIVSSVTKKLDYLVTGEKPTNRKVEQAKNLGIKILTQKEWSDLLN